MNRIRRPLVICIVSALSAGCTVFGGTPGIPGPSDPSYVLALGSVDTNGSLIRGTAIGGLTVTSGRTATGKYTVTISGTDAFSGIITDQFVVGLTPLDAQEDNVYAAEVAALSADAVTIGITAVDVDGGGAGMLVDDKFYFQIFLIP